jgi:hypothetical protein
MGALFMSSTMFRTLGAAALGRAVLSTVVSPTLIGQEKAAKKAKGRLPPYFAQVVTEKQRTDIYKIQKTYEEQIDALEAQLKTLQTQRDTEMEGLLSAEQKQKLDKLRADAAGKRKSKAATAAAEAEATETEATTTTTTAAPATSKPATATKAANR